jgi:hypothetical protein
MQNEEHFPILPEHVEADPARILESIVSELEALREFNPLGSTNGLVELHGALLVYELAGRVELIPSFRPVFTPRRVLEARVAWAAQRLAGRARGYEAARAATDRAARRIEELIHLIDPDLRVTVAA